jgi:hypothetical protein
MATSGNGHTNTSRPVCAQCGESGGSMWRLSARDGEIVPVHPRCAKAWYAADCPSGQDGDLWGPS